MSWNFEQNTGQVGEFKTILMGFFCDRLNWTIFVKYFLKLVKQNVGKSTGKVRENCQSEKVGTMNLLWSSVWKLQRRQSQLAAFVQAIIQAHINLSYMGQGFTKYFVMLGAKPKDMATFIDYVIKM